MQKTITKTSDTVGTKILLYLPVPFLIYAGLTVYQLTPYGLQTNLGYILGFERQLMLYGSTISLTLVFYIVAKITSASLSKLALWIFIGCLIAATIQMIWHYRSIYPQIKEENSINAYSITNKPNLEGTMFFGGVGMKGAYMTKMANALTQVGIEDVTIANPDLWSSGSILLDSLSVLFVNDYTNKVTTKGSLKEDKTSLNLIGYSFGSIQAAHASMKFTAEGYAIGKLVLIGSPIEASFLELLKVHPQIEEVIVIDLIEHGDPLHAGMSDLEIILSTPVLAWQFMHSKTGVGHYVYVAITNDADEKRKELAQLLYKKGLR